MTSDFEGQGRELGKTPAAPSCWRSLLGVVLVYIILAAQFESLVHPFTIMMSLPFAVIGGIAGLLIAEPVHVDDGDDRLHHADGARHQERHPPRRVHQPAPRAGESTHEALLEAGPVRLRPILMTTVAMIAGMIPVALARGDGAETRVPMAVAIIGGLVTSTVLTLGIVPVVYSLLDGLRNRLWRQAPQEVSPPEEATPRARAAAE